jgi:hypothetical protein
VLHEQRAHGGCLCQHLPQAWGWLSVIE